MYEREIVVVDYVDIVDEKQEHIVRLSGELYTK